MQSRLSVTTRLRRSCSHRRCLIPPSVFWPICVRHSRRLERHDLRERPYGYTHGFGTEAPADDSTNSGNVSGSFTNIPDCSTPTVPLTDDGGTDVTQPPAPVIDVPGNHGQYVSGATHAGVKGKALAEIAKDVKLGGPYKA